LQKFDDFLAFYLARCRSRQFERGQMQNLDAFEKRQSARNTAKMFFDLFIGLSA
jgi:hypothetical protein